MRSFRSLILGAMVAGLMVLTGCGTEPGPGEGEPAIEALESDSQALCRNDTYCEFYTDSSFSTQCGERQTCINCSSASNQWGCVGSPYRWCETMGECGGRAACVKCYPWGCISGPCP